VEWSQIGFDPLIGCSRRLRGVVILVGPTRSVLSVFRISKWSANFRHPHEHRDQWVSHTRDALRGDGILQETEVSFRVRARRVSRD